METNTYVSLWDKQRSKYAILINRGTFFGNLNQSLEGDFAALVKKLQALKTVYTSERFLFTDPWIWPFFTCKSAQTKPELLGSAASKVKIRTELERKKKTLTNPARLHCEI